MDEEFTTVASLQAIKRIEVPDDLVGALSFLTSDDAALMIGLLGQLFWLVWEDLCVL